MLSAPHLASVQKCFYYIPATSLQRKNIVIQLSFVGKEFKQPVAFFLSSKERACCT